MVWLHKKSAEWLCNEKMVVQSQSRGNNKGLTNLQHNWSSYWKCNFNNIQVRIDQFIWKSIIAHGLPSEGHWQWPARYLCHLQPHFRPPLLLWCLQVCSHLYKLTSPISAPFPAHLLGNGLVSICPSVLSGTYLINPYCRVGHTNLCWIQNNQFSFQSLGHHVLCQQWPNCVSSGPPRTVF